MVDSLSKPGDATYHARKKTILLLTWDDLHHNSIFFVPGFFLFHAHPCQTWS